MGVVKIPARSCRKTKLNAFTMGVVVFTASFLILWNTRGQTNYGRIAKSQSRAVTADTVNPANENAFVSVTGNLVSDELLGDPEFIQPGPYLVLARTVEMYAWVEKRESVTNHRRGGQTETITTFRNEKEWTAQPQDSSWFRQPPRPANPPMPHEGYSRPVRSARIGAFTVDPSDPSFLPGASYALPLTGQNAILSNGGRIESNYIYRGRGSMTSPEIGDVRVSFSVLTNGTYVTVFGRQSGGSIVRWTDPRDGSVSLFRAVPGDRNTAIAAMKEEYSRRYD